MEGDYLAPKPEETESPKFEESLPTPEFIEETSHELRQAKPALAGHVASEALKNNPNPEIRRMAAEESLDMDPDKLLKQVQEAADRDVAFEGTFEQSHERKDDPTPTYQDNSQTSVRAIVDVPNEPIVSVTPVPEYDQAVQQTSTAQDYQNIFREQPKPSLYKQAIVVGVTTAVAILAIFITIKLT